MTSIFQRAATAGTQKYGVLHLKIQIGKHREMGKGFPI